MSSPIDTQPKKSRRALKTVAWGGGGLVVLAVVGGVICKQRLDEFVALAHDRGVKFGSVAFDWSGHVRLHDVSVPLQDGPTIEAATVVMRPRVWSYGGEIHAENVRIDLGKMTWTMPGVDVEHANLDLTAMRSMLAAGAKTPAERIALLEAERIRIPTIQFGQAFKLGRQEVVYKDIVLDKLAQGRAARLRASGGQYDVTTDVAIAAAKNPTGKISASFGAVEIENVGVADTVRLYTEAAKPGDDSTMQLHGTFSMKDMRQQVQDGVVTIAQIRGDGFRVRMLPRPLLAFVSDISKVDAPDKLSEAERKAYFRQAISILDMFAEGDVEMRDLHVAVVERKPNGDVPVYGDIGRLGVKFSGRKFGFALGQVAFAGGPSDKLSIAELEVKDFSWAPILAALEKADLDGQRGGAKPSAALLMPELGSWRVADVVVDLPKSDVADRGSAAKTAGKRLKFSLKGGELRMMRPINGIPSSFRSAVTDLVVDPSSMESSVLDVLRALGYNQVATSLALDVDWHEADQTLAIDEVSFSAKDVGGIRMSGSIGGFGRDMFTHDPVQGEQAAQNLTARALSLRLEDGGLFDRLLKLRSDQSGMSVEEARASIAKLAQDLLHEALHDRDKVRDLEAAIGGFIAKPGVLQVSAKAKPDGGLSVADLAAAKQDPDGFLAKIDISVSRQ